MWLKFKEPIEVDGETFNELEIIVQHKNEEIKRHGGISTHQTYVVIKSPDKKELLEGISFCSERDQFIKKEGKLRALNRALKGDPKKVLLSKNNRKHLYKTLFPTFEV